MIKWDYEKAKEIALQYTSITLLKKEHSGCLGYIIRNNLSDELCSHMSHMNEKPSEYYTKEVCMGIISNYTNYKIFREENNRVYRIILKNGWKDELCSNLESHKENGYWTIERCKDIVDKYTNYNLFKDENRTLYNIICQKGWREDLLFHLECDFNKKHEGYWTIERCHEVALRYNKLSDFIKPDCDSGAYRTAKENGWLEYICSHMIEYKKPSGYWTKDICQEIALKYTSRKDFEKYDKTCYGVSEKMKIITEICSHMPPTGNRLKRLVYVYIFPDNHAYVGLTYNKTERYNSHMSSTKSQVYKHIQKTNLIPEYLILTEYIDSYLAAETEIYYIDYYKKQGHIMLNVGKGGNLGGNQRKWFFENTKEEASKYKTRTELRKNSYGAYKYASKNGWLDEFFPKKEKESL